MQGISLFACQHSFVLSLSFGGYDGTMVSYQTQEAEHFDENTYTMKWFESWRSSLSSSSWRQTVDDSLTSYQQHVDSLLLPWHSYYYPSPVNCVRYGC